MKKVLILHGTDGTSKDNWFQWLKVRLEEKKIKVRVPDLPHAEKPNISRYNSFIFQNKDWIFDKYTSIVGHSSGAVAILGLLQNLPEGTKVDICVLVGSFKDDLGWESLRELFLEDFDFDLIKRRAKKFIFIHSDNDPFCPLDHAQYLSSKLNGEVIVRKGQGHFSTTTNPEYTTFPFLFDLLEKELL